MSQLKSLLILIAFFGLGVLAGCASSDYKPIENPSDLKVSFVDTSLVGKEILL